MEGDEDGLRGDPNEEMAKGFQVCQGLPFWVPGQ